MLETLLVMPSEDVMRGSHSPPVDINGILDLGPSNCCRSIFLPGPRVFGLLVNFFLFNSRLGCFSLQAIYFEKFALQIYRFLHQEPWNFNARYLLTLNYLQKAREERFPQYICRVLERLTAVVLSNQFYSIKDVSYQYQNFQLLLCAAEVNLQQGNNSECFRLVRSALGSSLHNSYLFFAHLLLCRAYAAEDDIVSLSKEYRRCLELRTDSHIGWICLKFIESRYGLQDDSTTIPSSFEDCSKDIKLSWNMWMALFNMVQGLIAIWSGDFVAAEEFFTQACSLADAESCLFLCHGIIS